MPSWLVKTKVKTSRITCTFYLSVRYHQRVGMEPDARGAAHIHGLRRPQLCLLLLLGPLASCSCASSAGTTGSASGTAASGGVAAAAAAGPLLTSLSSVAVAVAPAAAVSPACQMVLDLWCNAGNECVPVIKRDHFALPLVSRDAQCSELTFDQV